MFIAISFLFFIDIFRRQIEFTLPKSNWHKIIIFFGLVLTFLYPLVGFAVGHFYPRTILPGSFPCPTTALALIFMSMSLPKTTRLLYFLLLFWAIPFPILIQIPRFGVFEDIIMLLVGIYSLILLIINWKKIKGKWFV